MKLKRLYSVSAAVMMMALSATGAERVKIILDVDLCEDVDDAGAVAVLHRLADLGEAEILGVLIVNFHPVVVFSG